MAANVEATPQRAQVRRTAQFHPSVWGDYFIKTVMDDKAVSLWSEQAKVLKEEVARMFTCDAEKPSGKLKLIDAIQRLDFQYPNIWNNCSH
ncbi:probable terpene synthase 3 [Mercurialis annua]|uniref:probable terpene synthase 3 n=1 Tax=Mercurialis annua TaxID=3986 RepID=UPI0021600A8E|nr:probable terpene synthase 3 [Mercurialis annua]